MVGRVTVIALEAIVSAFDDMQDPTGRAFAGIVFSGEHFAVFADAEAEGIPHAAGDTGEFLAVGCAMEDAALAGAGAGAAIGTRENPFLVEIFAEGEVEVAVGMPGESGKAVVGIGSLGIQDGDVLFLVGFTVAVGIADSKNAVTFREVDKRRCACRPWRKLGFRRVWDLDSPWAESGYDRR